MHAQAGRWPALAALATAALLAGCGRPPPVDDGRPPRAGAARSAREALRSAPASVPGAAPAPVSGSGGRPALGGLPGSAATPAEDARLSAQVRAALAADPETQALRMDVDTNAGVVTLSGPVPSLSLKARAAELARVVPQVQSVNDQLTLVTP